MKTSALLAILEAAYPDKHWTVQTANDDNPHAAILLSVDEMAVHDPFASLCGRFQQPDRYGLSEEHARALRRHNRAYEDCHRGLAHDLHEIFERVVKEVASRTDADPVAILDDLGFQDHDAGGGLIVYALFDNRGWHVQLAAADGSGRPRTFSDAVIGLYDTIGEVRVEGPYIFCLFRASMETPNFSFEAYGASHELAIYALKAGLQRHALQYNLEKDWYTDDDITCNEVHFGNCYRDGEPITSVPGAP